MQVPMAGLGENKSLGLERSVLVLTLCRMPSPYPAEASEQSFHVFPHSKPTSNHGSARYPKRTQNFALRKHKYLKMDGDGRRWTEMDGDG